MCSNQSGVGVTTDHDLTEALRAVSNGYPRHGRWPDTSDARLQGQSNRLLK